MSRACVRDLHQMYARALSQVAVKPAYKHLSQVVPRSQRFQGEIDAGHPIDKHEAVVLGLSTQETDNWNLERHYLIFEGQVSKASTIFKAMSEWRGALQKWRECVHIHDWQTAYPSPKTETLTHKKCNENLAKSTKNVQIKNKEMLEQYKKDHAVLGQVPAAHRAAPILTKTEGEALGMSNTEMDLWNMARQRMMADGMVSKLPGVFNTLWAWRDAVEKWRQCSHAKDTAYPLVHNAKPKDACDQAVVNIKKEV